MLSTKTTHLHGCYYMNQLSSEAGRLVKGKIMGGLSRRSLVRHLVVAGRALISTSSPRHRKGKRERFTQTPPQSPRSRSRSFAIPARRTTTGPVETHRGGRRHNVLTSPPPASNVLTSPPRPQASTQANKLRLFRYFEFVLFLRKLFLRSSHPSELPHALLSPRVAKQLTHCGLPRRHGRAADEGFPTGE